MFKNLFTVLFVSLVMVATCYSYTITLNQVTDGFKADIWSKASTTDHVWETDMAITPLKLTLNGKN